MLKILFFAVVIAWVIAFTLPLGLKMYRNYKKKKGESDAKS